METRKIVQDQYCFVCGNKGFFDKDCTSCGREATRKSLNFDKREDTEQFVQSVELAGIPDMYKGFIWDPTILKESKPGLVNDYVFESFVAQLEKINGVFASGILPQKSAVIIAPAGFSKTIFAYSCMQRALDSGFTVAPILDTVEIKRFLTLAGDNVNYRLYNKMSYDDYIMSDVLFATVTKLPAREWAYQTIQELIDRRARKGLSTFIISRYSLGEISKKDYSNQFSAIASSVSADTYKYPAVVKYQSISNDVEEC